MTERRKKPYLLAIAAIVAAALALSGCGASVTVFDYASDGVRVNAIEVELDGECLRRMERTAANGASGQWTVSEYLYALFTEYGYALDDAKHIDGGYSATYVKNFDVKTEKTDLDKLGTAIKYAYAYTENPFIRTVTETSPNPFNGLRQEYDNPDRQSALYTVKYGTVAVDEYGEQTVLFPAITDAFPALRGQNADGLRLNYVVNRSSRMKSTGIAGKSGGNTDNYEFSRYFDLTESEIGFSYKRPVPYGWYLTALISGAIVTAAIISAVRLKKKKRDRTPPATLIDRFPYNPEQYRSYDNLPVAHPEHKDK